MREVGCIQCENPRTPLFNNIGRGHLRPLVKVLMPSHKTKRSPPFHLRTLALIFYLKGAVEERGGKVRGAEINLHRLCIFVFRILHSHSPPNIHCFCFPQPGLPNLKNSLNALTQMSPFPYLNAAAQQPTLQRCNRFTSTMIFNIKLNIGS